MPATLDFYVVAVAGPEPNWIRWDPNTNLPCFTGIRPDGVSFSEATALKRRADICCGGTLSIVPLSEFGGIQIETAPGSGVYEWFVNAGDEVDA